jgi:exodeoxyribonuclease V beta subunit
VKEAQGPYWLAQAGDRLRILEPDPDQLARLDQERLGEDVRKLYVALTRARHAVWLALGPLRQAPPSGIGHVLGADLQDAWNGLVQSAPGHFAWDTPSAGPLMQPDGCSPEAEPLGPVRRLTAPAVGQSWWLASYSALHLAGSADSRPNGPDPTPETAAEDTLREGRRTDAPEGEPARADAWGQAAGAGLEDFPRGGEAGTFLHGLLEWAGQRRFCELDEARDLIARRCAVRGWESHIEALHQWLVRFAQTTWRPSLPGSPALRLDRLQACRPEMEFWLPAEQVDVTRLDRLLMRRTFGAASRPALAPARLNGMFKGFIDLTLQSGDRYYVIDYKSNDLGPLAADYRPEALVAALCAHRYDVQMLMYMLALHRQLRARRADYDYERDMGGAVYVFLRGQDAPGQGLLAWRPPLALIETLDALFMGREAGDGES